MEIELQPINDTRKSFYRKARVRYNKDKTKLTLISYDTEVAYIKFRRGYGTAFVLGQWSGTTTRHIKEFLKQNGFKAENMKQILKDYKYM